MATRTVEIRRLLDAGVRVTINSDDPAYFPGYMNENLAAAEAAAGLSRDELVQVTRNAFTISWASATDRGRYLAALESYVAGAAGPS